MKNWAGNLIFSPSKTHSPKNTDEIKKIIKEAIEGQNVIRTRGTAHSWTGLFETNQIFIDLDHMQGLIDVNQSEKTIKAFAGTKLSLFGEEGFKHELAMANQGDINKQSLAGATSTGTHGTGINLQSVANQIIALTLIDGHGNEIEINENSPFFNAARLSLGSLGIISDITMKLVPSYKLKVRTFHEPIDEAIKFCEDRLYKNRHLEMFYFPVGDWSLTKIMNETNEDVTPKTMFHTINEKIIENWLYIQLNKIASSTGRYKLIDKVMQTFVSSEEKVDWSHRAFPTERDVKFMEMEYNLPIEKFHSVFSEIRQAIKNNNFQTLLPIEIRFVKKDSIWLSPAFERDSVYFAIHTYITEEYRPYFDCIEAIFKKHHGRPHWGKWHTLKKDDFLKVYPKFEDFMKVRNEFDPHGIFLNNHLKEIFGV
jgi:FAD-linked oxidoreductase